MSATRTSRKTRRHYRLLTELSNELLEIAERPDRLLTTLATDVSGWSVAQQLDHIAGSNLAIVEGLVTGLDSPPSEPADRLKLVGRIVLWTGFIPRGVGKAPEQSLPRCDSVEEVRERLAESREGIADLEPRLPGIDGADWRFEHPYFGGLAPREWLRFMVIHTRHHLKIIRDIEEALAGAAGPGAGAGTSESGEEQSVG